MFDSRSLVVFFMFNIEKSEEKCLSEGIDMFISPSRRDNGLQIEARKEAGEFPIGEVNSVRAFTTTKCFAVFRAHLLNEHEMLEIIDTQFVRKSYNVCGSDSSKIFNRRNIKHGVDLLRSRPYRLHLRVCGFFR